MTGSVTLASRLTRLHIKVLEVSALRVLSSVRLEAAAGLNVLYGPNGSGKTSVLEAIHLLGLGRSFRSRQIRELVRRGERRLQVVGSLSGAQGEQRIGIEHGSDGLTIRCDGEALRASSSLARILPLVLISPDSQRLLTDGARLRRELIDWILFHVEPSYLPVFQRFRKALRQRNAELRAGGGDRAVASWDAELGAAGSALHEMRAAHLASMLPRIREFLGSLLSIPVQIGYEPGWMTDSPLSLALAEALPGDRRRGYTERGPQRADLSLRVDGTAAHRVLSRGEAKLFVVGLLLAQADRLADLTHRTPVILVDELASELDADARARVFSALSRLAAQTFVTAVSQELAESAQCEGDSVFHVERGEVSRVV